MGESVSAMIPDTATAPASEKANSVNRRAGETALKADRYVDRHQHHGHGQDGAAELARRDDGGIERRAALLFHVPIDILDDDDGIIDHESDGQHQRQQRQ